MKPFKSALITSLFIANLCHFTMGYAKNDVKNAPAACPTPAEMGALHLYGEWQATWTGVDAPATLRLGRHPEHLDGVRGTIQRGTAEALVAGDVDNGEFNLEESTDGRTIAATWTGKVVENACGKEIQGLWNKAADNSERRFVLRKLPGWR